MQPQKDQISVQDFVSFQLQKMLDKESIGLNGQKETLKTLTARLGLKSPSLLSMILNGKRLPSEKLLEQLFDLWKVSAKDRKILRLQLQIEKKIHKGKEALSLMQEMRRLNPPTGFYKMKLNEIESVRDWYVLVVRAMINSPDFQNDPKWISQRLGGKISPKQAQKAVQLLLDRGLVLLDPETQKITVGQESIETGQDIPLESIRNHHRGMLNRASEALVEQTVDERLFNSLTLNFNKEKLKLAKERIVEFAKSFHAEFADDSAESVYQLNLQFFSHTFSAKGKEK